MYAYNACRICNDCRFKNTHIHTLQYFYTDNDTLMHAGEYYSECNICISDIRVDHTHTHNKDVPIICICIIKTWKKHGLNVTLLCKEVWASEWKVYCNGRMHAVLNKSPQWCARQKNKISVTPKTVFALCPGFPSWTVSYSALALGTYYTFIEMAWTFSVWHGLQHLIENAALVN